MWLLLLSCQGTTTATINDGVGTIADPSDVVAPTIVFSPIEGAQPFGSDVTLTAEITDAGSGLFVVQLWYKNETDNDAAYESRAMVPQGQDSPVWTGTIPGASHRSGGMDYYIEAVDRSQNGVTEPPDGPDDPFHIRLSVN